MSGFCVGSIELFEILSLEVRKQTFVYFVKSFPPIKGRNPIKNSIAYEWVLNEKVMEPLTWFTG